MTRSRLLVLLASLPLLACDASDGANRETGPNTVGDDGDDDPNTTSAVTATTGLTGITQGNTSSDPSSDTDDESTTGTTLGSSDDTSEDPTSGGSTSSGGEGDTSSEGSSSSSESSTDTGPPPDNVDLSGFELVQTATAQTFFLPEGTVLEPGQRLVVGRDASRGAFENHWGVVLGDEVVYVDAAGEFPLINGDEVFSVFDASGGFVDGPSPQLGEGQTLQRIDLESSGAAAWQSSAFGSATPGEAWPIDTAASGVFLTEASDSQGTGAFVYEFVELQAWP